MLRVYNKSSKAIVDGKPKSPTPEQLEFGEIAINYAKGHETIFFKNSQGEVIPYKTGEGGGGGEIIGDYIDDVKYNATDKKLVFYKGSTVICDVDATNFVKDGMVEDVTLRNGYLTITFNEDAKEKRIETYIGDMFSADNYYTKKEVDDKIAKITSGGDIDLDGYYSKDELIFNKDQKTIFYNNNNYKTVSWFVVEGTLDIPILVYMKDTEELKLVSDHSLLDPETMVPVGIEAVPASHNMYGDGSSGIVSLVNMCSTSPDVGDIDKGLEDNGVRMFWGNSGHGLTSYTQYPSLGKCSEGLNAVVIANNENSAQLPSDMFQTGIVCLTDPTTRYYDNVDTGRTFTPSPYIMENKNPLYSAPSYGGGKNPLSRFDGKSNTATLVNNATGQTGWKTATTITSSAGKGYFPMACCCWRYSTVGTNQGDWYLPAMGELGYLIPRFNKLNETINMLNRKFGKCATQISDGNVGSQNYMSSTPQAGSSINRIGLKYQNGGRTNCDSSELARAFYKFTPKTND